MAETKSISTNHGQGGLALAFSGKTRLPKKGIICQALSGSLGERISQVSRQNTVRST
jgi:hypothetical protein